ncbi:hypothetical protein Ccrd_003241 [Cynara cardunculus var. scolymus]|uniref:Uncharacterized protein n=1 Tax=Cynara cardunculus var. scolymus TaxID=59895 RepID=A0A103XPY6_CYNCS|nr:hypothetical protein Ccrd_003241 [Cynara cardunculus var. scolymus]
MERSSEEVIPSEAAVLITHRTDPIRYNQNLDPRLISTSSLSRPEWPTIDGPLGLSEQDAVGYAPPLSSSLSDHIFTTLVVNHPRPSLSSFFCCVRRCEPLTTTLVYSVDFIPSTIVNSALVFSSSPPKTTTRAILLLQSASKRPSHYPSLSSFSFKVARMTSKQPDQLVSNRSRGSVDPETTPKVSKAGGRWLTVDSISNGGTTSNIKFTNGALTFCCLEAFLQVETS